MKKYKNHPLHLAILLFILCCITTGVYSYMFMKTNTISNQFIPGLVSCVVNEKVVDYTKEEITVNNTGNIEAYIRVRFVTYWVNENYVIISKPSDTLTIIPSSGWISGENNTYYYSMPIAPGSSTPNLLSNTIELKTEDGYYQVIDVFAEAIQAQPTEAVTNSWGVTIDSNGNITGVN